MPAEGFITDWSTTVGAGGIGGTAADTTLTVSDVAPTNRGANRLRGRVLMVRVCNADGTNAEFMRATIPADGSVNWSVERAAEAPARYPRAAHAAGSLVIPVVTASVLEAKGQPVKTLHKSPAVRAGRVWRFDASRPMLMALTWDITGFTYGTDAAEGGRPVLLPAAYPTWSRVLLDGVLLRDVRVSSRFRLPADAHPSTVVRNVARYLSDTLNWRGVKTFNAGNPVLAFEVQQESGTGAVGQAQAVDLSVSRVYRQRIEVIGSLVRYKVWVDGTPEPDWQIQKMMGASGSKTFEHGLAGLMWQDVAGGSNLSELVVTELLPIGENLLLNPDLTLYEVSNGAGNGQILSWSVTPPGGASLTEFVDVTVEGVTKKWLHLKRPTTSDPAISGPVQNVFLLDWMDVYSSGSPVAGSVSQAWMGANTQLLQSRKFEVGVTTMADGIRHGSGNTFLGVAVDCYWFDETVTESNVSWANAGHAGYYKSIGPNKADLAGNQIGDGTDGTGSWGLRRDTVHLELDGTAQIARLDFAIVIHDSDIIGEFWMTDFELRPVA